MGNPSENVNISCVAQLCRSEILDCPFLFPSFGGTVALERRRPRSARLMVMVLRCFVGYAFPFVYAHMPRLAVGKCGSEDFV